MPDVASVAVLWREEVKMGKYASHDELAGNAPPDYRDNTTQEVYRGGLSRIAPPGMRPKETRCRRFEERTDFDASVRWHYNYDLAMFGGTEIGHPTAGTKQMTLEEMHRRR
jgi:hypothetical protein